MIKEALTEQIIGAATEAHRHCAGTEAGDQVDAAVT